MKINAEISRRFFAKLQVYGPAMCWPWQGARTRGGYGHMKLPGSRKTIRASRLAYIMFNGPLPKKKKVLHSCDNPPCCNPNHLTKSTQARNVKDAIERGRHKPAPIRSGQNHPISKITDAQAESIQQSTRLQREDAVLYGISQSMVSRIRRGLRKKAE